MFNLKQKYKSFVSILFMLLSGVVDANSCVVVLYHRFSDTTPQSTSISPKLFEQHLQYLQNNDFKVLKLKTMLKRLDNNNLPNKCVVLTADDAYQSIVKNAYPLLKKYQMPLAVFVSTDAVDKKYGAIMTWAQARNTRDYLQFYNHTSRHRHLLDLDRAQIKTEIEQAQERLKKNLGTNNKILAYPYGESSLEILEQVKNMGYIAFGQHSGVVSSKSDLQNLPRFPMASHFAKMKSFKLKINTLPMPIMQTKINTVIADNNPPILHLSFNNPLTPERQQQFNCFADGGVNMNWITNQKVSIVAKKPLTSRRSKYNCTLPSGNKNRYYWYSVQWVNPKIAE